MQDRIPQTLLHEKERSGGMGGTHCQPASVLQVIMGKRDSRWERQGDRLEEAVSSVLKDVGKG